MAQKNAENFNRNNRNQGPVPGKKFSSGKGGDYIDYEVVN